MTAPTTTTLQEQLALWSRGIRHELQFWDHVMQTAGGQWPEDWRARMDPASPLDAFVSAHARALGRSALRILDVGAGPLTCLGYALPGLTLEIVPTDPLAALYAGLFRRHGITPPLETRFAVVEDLALFLPEGGFDLVHCRNALDHSFDPLRGIEQMLAMARVGGRVLLRHFANEAAREAYTGFHQYNFAVRDGRFVVWNREGETDVAAGLATPARLTVQGTDWVEVVIEKTGEPPAPPPGQARERMAAYLAAFVAVLGEATLPKAAPAGR
jgi:SAM-dependent methyltransferase